jgi:hypothetical protein
MPCPLSLNDRPLAPSVSRLGGVMTKGLVGDLKALEERMIKETDRTEEHKKHNHQLTRQARVARRERHKRHTIEKHQGRAD